MRQSKGVQLGIVIASGVLFILVAMLVLAGISTPTYADPIDPPEGYPKLALSVKTVTPTLANVGGGTLAYRVEIRNTGAYTATGVSLSDAIPASTTYNTDAQASAGPAPSFDGTTLTWNGDVGFDTTVVISFSVNVAAGFSGLMRNTATINHPLIPETVTAHADAMITDVPVMAIGKTALPHKLGANKPLVYTLVVTNIGQPATGLSITVTDSIPADTGSAIPGPDGTVNSGIVTWLRSVTLDTGETDIFTFSVTVDDVVSGTIISNDDYQVTNPLSGVASGNAYTSTVIEPIFLIGKSIWPDPPGSNTNSVYTITILNKGSLATDLVVTDTIPLSVTYQNGGDAVVGQTISWTLASLATGETAEFTFTVSISDVADILVVNSDYGVCSAEGICKLGPVLTSVVGGPNFETAVFLDPIAKKPGGGPNTGPVTPTLVVRNIGPGDAIDATALLKFERISVSAADVVVVPVGLGTPVPLPAGPDCGSKCDSYVWIGSLNVGEVVTFTTLGGQSTIGGAEGTNYTATVVITDSLRNMVTDPVTGTAVGHVTHFANLLPKKSAPTVIGRGQLLTYTITVFNTGLTTDDPPLPWLIDTIPASVTVVSISDGGFTQTITQSGNVIISPTTIISWALPAMSTGEIVSRSFTVLVDDNLISGTQILNNEYEAFWYETNDNAIHSLKGEPITTTVQEIGLIDSYKEVEPVAILPGTGNVLTFTIHVVNSSPIDLSGVTVSDLLPWEVSTYRRDAIATSGSIISDIVSLSWTGNVASFSEELITLTVEVDPGYEGVLTNTATISHADLLSPVEVNAVAYVTAEPVLKITKSASPNPVGLGSELLYTLKVINLGQQATNLVVTDTVPANVTYVANSATDGGGLVGGNQVKWTFPVLESGETKQLTFRVVVDSGTSVVNDQYAVDSAEGVTGIGLPVVTQINVAGRSLYLPLLLK